MGNRQRLIIIRCTALIALAVCAALLMGYLRPASHLCGFDFDCDEVLSSRFSKLAGIPLPVYGMLTFAAIFACSLASRPQWGQALRYLALAASLAGLALILVQVFVLHSVCPFCLVVDCCALVLAYAAFGWRADALPMLPRRVRQLWLGAAVGALAVGAALGAASSWLPGKEANPPPPEVEAHWVPYKVTIVEVVDFECPHCRAMHSVLSRFLREEGKDLHYVRIVAPMAKHPHAKDAARAYLCAQAQDKDEAMADQLFDAVDLTPAGCERLAEMLGLSKSAYQTCVASEEIEKRIDANVRWVKKAAPKGLPCIWVQDQQLSGSPSLDDLRKAVATAELRLHASGR
ncbi:MAG TPA: thioredoxin domain-containing protein [Gemmataceae bacterium]|nr:thioredoxin domain-containing protein [Gemmataceae bacterium]